MLFDEKEGILQRWNQHTEKFLINKGEKPTIYKIMKGFAVLTFEVISALAEMDWKKQ